MVAISAAAHVAAILTAAFLPSPSTLSVPSAVTVDLVAIAPTPRAAAPPRPKAAPPAPAPKPVEAAKPKPTPPPDKAVVLPKEAREPKPTPKPAAKPEPVPKPEAKPQPEAPQRSYADIMRDLKSRVDTDDDVEAPPAQVASIGSPTGGSTRGIRLDPATAAWMRDARIHVRKSWVLAPGFRSESLETHLSVELDSRGNVIGEPQITKRSGNPWYDDSVVRAIQKASPLPAPPEAGDWPFVFRPEETL